MSSEFTGYPSSFPTGTPRLRSLQLALKYDPVCVLRLSHGLDLEGKKSVGHRSYAEYLFI